MIHCGDFTNCGSMLELQKAVDLLTSVDAELKLVIAGNHDTTLDHDYCYGRHGQEPLFDYTNEPTVNPEKCLQLWKSKTESAGITYLEEGTHTFHLKSGVKFTVYATPFQPGPGNWAFQYRHDDDRYNKAEHSLTDARNISENPIPDDVHVVISHGPMLNILDLTTRGDTAGCAHLARAVMRTRPMLHLCGHIHEGWGGRRILWSDDATDVATSEMTIRQWGRSAPRCGAKSITRVKADNLSPSGDHAPYIDISRGSVKPLVHGEETISINASIVNNANEAVHAPWLIDLDLPLGA